MEKDDVKAISAGAWYTVSNIALRAIGIITAPIFTRLLTTADYGVVSNFTSWQNIISIFTSMSLSYSIGRAKIDFPSDFDSFLSAIQGLSTIVSVCLFALAFLFRTQLSEAMALDISLVVALFFYLIFYSSIEYVQSKFRFEYKYKENVAIAIYNTVSVVILSILLIIYWNKPGYYGRIVGMLVPGFILAFACWIAIFRRGKKFLVKAYWDYAMKIALPMIPHALAMIVLGQIDRIMIVKLVGESEAGIYSFGYSYAIIGSVVINAVCQAWQPWLYEKLHEEDYHEIKRANKPLNALVAVFTLTLIAVAPEAIEILGAKPFWDAKWMVAPVVLGTFYQYIYNNFSAIELYTKKTIWIAVGSVMAAALNYVLNYLCIPRFGYNAAAFTTMAGYLALMIFHWIFSVVTYGRFVYDTKDLIHILFVTTALGMVMFMDYDGWIIRYALLSIVIVLYLMRYWQSFKRIGMMILHKGRKN